MQISDNDDYSYKTIYLDIMSLIFCKFKLEELFLAQFYFATQATIPSDIYKYNEPHTSWP